MAKYSLEAAEKAVSSLLQSELPAQLDVVEAYWSGEGDALSLGDVVTWLEGHNPTVVERPRADFPIVTIFVMNQEALPGADQWGYGPAQFTAMVNWFVDADNEVNCNKLAKRYGEAIEAVLRANQRVSDGLTNVTFVPNLEISTAEREFDTGSGSEMSGDEWFTQMGQATWYLEAVIYG